MSFEDISRQMTEINLALSPYAETTVLIKYRYKTCVKKSEKWQDFSGPFIVAFMLMLYCDCSDVNSRKSSDDWTNFIL